MRKLGDAGSTVPASLLPNSVGAGSVTGAVLGAGEGGGRTKNGVRQRSPRSWLACDPGSVADDIALSQGFSQSARVRDHFLLGDRKQTRVPGRHDFDEPPDCDQSVHAKGYLVGISSEVWPACLNDQLRCFL